MSGEIITVLGNRDPELIEGPALAHEHLRIDLSHEDDPHGYLRDDAAVVGELAEARKRHGLGLVIELTCQGMGRETLALRGLSEESGVEVVCATGFYYERFHPSYVEDTSTEALAERLVSDIEVGIDQTGVRPGIIGEIGSHGPEMTPTEERCFRAAARAALKTGLSVSTHAHLGVGAPSQLELLMEEGLPAERVCLGHQDLIDAPTQHRELAEEGAYIAFDTIGKESYQPDDVRQRLILDLLEEGNKDRILLSNDISRESYLQSRGGVGYSHLFRSFIPKLQGAGVDEDTLGILLQENPRRLLTREEPHPG